MNKSKTIIGMSLLAASLIIPTAKGFADDDDRRNIRNQRQDLRQDQQQLEQLRQREGDKAEAREYNGKIRELRKDMQQDKRNLRRGEHEREREHEHEHERD